MSGHAHLTPAQIRAKLNHPVVDGDGHWVEYDPVFSEQMRKVGGDLAADGFLAAMAVTRDSLLMSVEERRRRRVSMPGFWTRSNAAYRLLGGRLRPLRETLARTLADERERGLDRERRSGLSRADELALLAELPG